MNESHVINMYTCMDIYHVQLHVYVYCKIKYLFVEPRAFQGVFYLASLSIKAYVIYNMKLEKKPFITTRMTQ